MANKESQTVEYKQNWHNEYLKVVSAFANSSGGVLYIGLDDQGKSFGLKNVKKLLEDIPNTNRTGIAGTGFFRRKWCNDRYVL